MKNMNAKVHTPPPSIKLSMVFFLFAMECARDASKHYNIFHLNLPLASGGQQLLFCCFLNLITLHLPSFFWNHRVNTHRSIAFLEHIIYYYFTMALLLMCLEYSQDSEPSSISYDSALSEIIIASQLSLYFLWHVFHELKLETQCSKRQCTLFPRLIESSIYIFVIIILPIFWLGVDGPESKWYERKCFLDTQNISQKTPPSEEIQYRLWPHTLYLFSTFILPEIAAVIFQTFESVNRLFFSKTNP
jgi:hypothetical protein